MKWFGDMKISVRLIAAFLVVAVLAAVVGVIGITQLEKVHEEYNVLYADYGIAQGIAGNIAMHFRNIRIALRDMVLLDDIAARQKYRDKIAGFKTELNTLIAAFGETNNSDAGKQQQLELVANMDAYYAVADRIMALALEGKTDEAIALIYGEAVDVTAKADASVEEAVARKQRNGKTRQDGLLATVASTEAILWAIIASAFVIAVTIGLLSSRSISKPIGRLLNGAKRLAAGDTGISLDSRARDEVGLLSAAFGNVIETLRTMMTDAQTLSDAAIVGDLHVRADSSQHQGDFRRIIEGVNTTLDTLVGHIDAIQAPVMIVDTGYGIRYMNKSGAQLLGKTQAQLIGQKCYDQFRTSDCKTGRCACGRAMQGNASAQSETDAHPNGMNLDISYIGVPLHSTDGAVIGALEVVTDMTAIRTAQRVAEKQAKYQAEHVDKLLTNLERLAKGDLTCDMEVTPADQDTEAIHDLFTNICGNLHTSLGAIRGYISEIAGTLGEMARGNMDTGIDREYLGDFVELKDSINKIILSLNDTLSEINSSTEQVAAGTQQVAAGSQALSQGATEQASAIEELTAALAEIAAQTRQNAMSANEASALAQSAKQDAQDGDSRMDQLQQAMGEINESSASISRIIKVIDEIAFQTNLLALNAAVEAARAGQHGKGFAVVAEEVRSLAQRSANAARETTQMIEESIKKVKDGTRIANDTAHALNRIVVGVQKATDLVGSIAQASNEQAMAVTQVNSGVEQVSQVTQTNSATAEESAAASEELSSQAVILKDMVGRFSLRGQSQLPGQRGALRTKCDGRTLPAGKHPSAKPRISLTDAEYGKY